MKRSPNRKASSEHGDLLNVRGTAPFVPGGVADSKGQHLYLPSTQGGIVALAAATGEPLWTSKETDLPLLATNGSLLTAAYREGAVFILLNADTGKVLQVFTPALTLVPGDQWRVTAVRREENQIHIAWLSLHGNRLGGVPQIVEKEGFTTIALDNGRVRTHPIEPQSDAQEAFAELTGDLTLLYSADGTNAAWHAGNYIAALVVDNEKQRLLLFTWNLRKDKALKRRVLLSRLPRSGYLQHHPSPDVDHVYLLLCNDKEENGVPAGGLCHWRIIRVSDGKLLMSMPNRQGLQPPISVIGNHLLYVEIGNIPTKLQPPLRRLWAIDVATGEAAWSCDIGQRETGQLL